MAGATKHLLVLLLAHPLPTFLDQRSHTGDEPTGADAVLRKSDTV